MAGKVNKRGVIRQFTSLFFKGGSVLVTFALAKLYMQFRGDTEYGEYILTHGYLLTFGTLAGVGQGLLALRTFAGKETFDVDLLTLKAMGVALNIVAIAMVGALIASLESISTLADWRLLVAFIAYSFSLFLFEVSRYWLNGNWYILFKDILRSAVVMVFLLSKYEAEPVEMLMTSGLITCLITLAVVLIRSYGSTPEHSGMSPKLFWSVYTKGLSLSLGSGLQVFKGWLEVFLAGAFLPLGQVALYSVVQKLGKLVNLPLVALNADIAKGLARLAEGHQLSDRHRQLIRLSKLTTFAFAMLALLCSPWFLKFYGYPAEPLFLILCVTVILCNVLNVFFGPVGLYFQLSDMRDYFVRSTAVSLVITLILAFTTVPWLGLNGLAIATLISGTLWNYMLHRRMVNTTGNSFL